MRVLGERWDGGGRTGSEVVGTEEGPEGYTEGRKRPRREVRRRGSP